MCIRDREKPWDLSSLKDMITPAEELLEAELRFNQKEFYQLLYRMTLDMDDLYQDLTFYLGALESVSYTHIDVYKRQPLLSSVRGAYPSGCRGGLWHESDFRADPG